MSLEEKRLFLIHTLTMMDDESQMDRLIANLRYDESAGLPVEVLELLGRHSKKEISDGLVFTQQQVMDEMRKRPL